MSKLSGQIAALGAIFITAVTLSACGGGIPGNAAFHFNAALDLYAPYSISTYSAVAPANSAVTIIVTPWAIPQYTAITPNVSNLTITTELLSELLKPADGKN